MNLYIALFLSRMFQEEQKSMLQKLYGEPTSSTVLTPPSVRRNTLSSPRPRTPLSALDISSTPQPSPPILRKMAGVAPSSSSWKASEFVDSSYPSSPTIHRKNQISVKPKIPFSSEPQSQNLSLSLHQKASTARPLSPNLYNSTAGSLSSNQKKRTTRPLSPLGNYHPSPPTVRKEDKQFSKASNLSAATSVIPKEKSAMSRDISLKEDDIKSLFAKSALSGNESPKEDVIKSFFEYEHEQNISANRNSQALLCESNLVTRIKESEANLSSPASLSPPMIPKRPRRPSVVLHDLTSDVEGSNPTELIHGDSPAVTPQSSLTDMGQIITK